MAQKNNEVSRRDFLKHSAALGVGAVIGPYLYRDAFAASRDRVTSIRTPAPTPSIPIIKAPVLSMAIGSMS